MSKEVESHVLNEYALLREMGSGAYGHVWEVEQKRTKRRFALKKVFDAFRNSIDAQRTYREVSILGQLNHENIVKLYRVLKSKNKKDLYLVFEFMEADLHSIVGSNILQKMHQIYVFYQILKALKYLHSAELIHRDLKPSNVLLNSQCKAKVCDFGLVRTLNQERDEEAILSEQVATKWYRAPQLLLGSRSYKKPIDVWSYGCIVAEILIGKPLFAGDSTLNQLQKIMEFTGNISHADIDSLDSPVAEQLITQIRVKKRSFRQYFSSVDPDFWVLIKGTLQFNPNKRLTIDQTLQLELFDEFREEIKTLKNSPMPIRPEIDDNVRYGLKVYRDKIYEDIDKIQQASSTKKKLAEVQNLFKPLAPSGPKKRVTSQEKSIHKQNSKIKHRQYSIGSQNKSRTKPLNSEKQKEKKAQSLGKLNSSTKSTFIPKKKCQSPYKPYLETLKNTPKHLSHSSHSQIFTCYNTKNIIPTNFNSSKIRKVLQPFLKNKAGEEKREMPLINKKKVLKKVSSAQEKKFFTNNNILARIGFG